MSALDVIPLPGQPGRHARRLVVQAWQRAGSPPVNSAGRLYAMQKYFYDGWRAGRPGFNPADNPDDESQRLAHVRFAALDIDPTPSRIQKLSAAGLYRPYTYEPWHWEVPDVRRYAIVRSIPAPPVTPTPPIPEEQGDITMRVIWNRDDKNDATRRAVVGELTFHVQGPGASSNERDLWGDVVDVSATEWKSALNMVNTRRAMNGLKPLRGVRGEFPTPIA